MKKWLYLMISLALFAGIFWFSSQDADASSSQSDDVIVKLKMMTEEEMIKDPKKADIYRFSVRKLAHFCVYSLLGMFLFLTIKEFTDALGFSLLLAWLTTVIFAIGDEYHQSFVPGRSMEFRDVLIDSGGAFLGILLLYLFFKSKSRKKSYQNVYYFSR